MSYGKEEERKPDERQEIGERRERERRRRKRVSENPGNE